MDFYLIYFEEFYMKIWKKKFIIFINIIKTFNNIYIYHEYFIYNIKSIFFKILKLLIIYWNWNIIIIKLLFNKIF